MFAECSAVLHLCKLMGLLSCAFWISESSVALLDMKDGDSEGKAGNSVSGPHAVLTFSPIIQPPLVHQVHTNKRAGV